MACGGVTANVGVSYVWHGARVPRGLEVLKVHGFLICPATGRALVQEYEGSFNLIGVRAGSALA